MFTVQKSTMRQAARFMWALWVVAAFCAGSALRSQAQAPPSNDNLLNAQALVGVSGTVSGTNLQATVEVGEPNPTLTAPAAGTIWYSWTAPITSAIDFNTRNSTVTNNGGALPTTLAVYTLKNAAGALAYTNLTQVVGGQNDSNANYPNTSRVEFAAALGTTYYIQVGSATNLEGYPVLNWNSSLLSGGFGFSTTVYPMSSLENWLPDNDGSVSPSLFGIQQGQANARVTVTRSGGNVGRCEVTVSLGVAYYTNVYTTNFVGTNVFITNYSAYPPTFANATNFTNIFFTNVASVNYFTNFANGGFVGEPIDNDVEITQTNIGFLPNGPFFNLGPYSTTLTLPANLINFFANFPCPINPPLVPATSFLLVTNANGSLTSFTTNIFCQETNVVVLVPASVANVQFTPFTEELTFDDFQMSQDIYVQLYPGLNTRDTKVYPSVVDYPTAGPEDSTNGIFGFNGVGNYSYAGLDGLAQLTLSNVVLDPQEAQDIVPPTITQSNAYIGILNFYGNPTPVYSNAPAGSQIASLNIERYTYRCDKDCNTAVVWAQRSYRRQAASVAHTAHYTIDSTLENITWIDDNHFATVADSDYAVPRGNPNQTDYDFLAPLTSGAVYDNGAVVPGTTTWVAPDGTVTWPMLSIAAAGIYIPITNNAAVEFDEDIEVQLYLTTGDAQQDEGATFPATLGPIDEARLTINFDNDGVGTQPGGAVDKNYNVDASPGSQPPDNLTPGANYQVNAVAIDSTGRAVIAGDFDAYNDTPLNFLTRALPSGFIDTTFSALGTGPNNFVNAVVLDTTGRIIIGGNFTAFNSSNTFHIARLLANGGLDPSFVSGYGFNGNVYALALDASGNILVGGDFTSYNTTNCNHIARLLPSGGLDATFLPGSGIGVTNGTDGDVNAVAVDSQNRIVLGGAFGYVNGTNWSHIARLLNNGSLDLTFNPGFGADGNVLAVAVQTDNSIILGGAFKNFNLITRNSIARLTPSGALDAGFAPGSGFNDIVYSLALQPDGNILAGGQFTMYNGTRRVGMARILGGQANPGQGGWLDTSFMDTSYNQFAGIINPYYNTNAITTNSYSINFFYPDPFNERNQVRTMALQNDGNIIIGGSFSRLGGGFARDDVHIRMNVARVIGLATPGPEEGGIGNCPGNLGMTQSPYSAGDTGQQAYITLDRQNGSLGPIKVTLGTNTLPPSSSSATAADFGLRGVGAGNAVSIYDTLWDNGVGVGPANYGWRKTDATFGLNNQVGGNANLFLKINNDPGAAPILYASMNLLDLTSTNILGLGGVPIPFGPALGQYSAGLDIINNNFPAGTIGFGATNFNVLESAGTVTVTLLRTNGSYGNVSITPNYINGTAVNGNDFTWTSVPPVQFQNGVTSNSFTIPIIDHTTQQSNKFFYIYLSSPTGGAGVDTNITPVVPSNSVVTIVDDHFQPGYLSFSSPTYSVLKPGVATITVSRSGAGLDQVSVTAGTRDGSAVNGVNYVGVTNQLNWLSQDISPRTITVQTLQDGTVDGPKTINLFLTNAVVAGLPNDNSQVLISPSNSVLTIVDTDTNGYLNFLTHNFSVYQNAGRALITVTRSGLGNLVGTETVNFTTYSLSNVQLPYIAAVAGSNYGFTNGQLTFPPGVTSASFSVPVYQTAETSPSDRLVGLQLFNGSPTNISGLFPKLAVLTILDPQLHVNSAGSVDTTTQNGAGFNAYVNSLSLQPDGSILAGGDFSYFNGYPFNYLARILPDGNYDSGFLSGLAGPNGNVWQVLSQPPNAGIQNGNIMVGGDFTQVNTVNLPRIARLNLDGGIDTSFNPGSGADATVYAITTMILPTAGTNNSTNYVIGGAFANYGGYSAGGVARLTSTGGLDPSFNPGFGVIGSNSAVHALAITAVNQILVGGDFVLFNNQAHHHLVELNLDGTVNTNFAAFDGIRSDINGPVRAIAVQPDGRILIGGLFTGVNGTNFNYVARLNSDGSTDTNFNIGVGCNNNVQSLALDDQLRILVGGAFTQASGVTRNGLTRLNADGTVDPSINFGFGANGFVDTIVLQTNDEINIGGGFSTFNTVPENNYARLFGGANAGNGSIEFSQQTFGILENPTNTTNATIGIERVGGTFGSPSVTAVFFTSNNTAVPNEAVPGRDYIAVAQTVSFPQGETFELVPVPITYNSAVGPDVLVSLELTNPISNLEALGPQVSATLIITNDNAGIEFAAQGFNQTADAGEVAIPLVRVGNTNSTAFITVYTGTNGTAGAFTNYVPATNVLVFYPGVVTNYWLLTILNSPTTFADTTVDLEMENATNAVIASPDSATLTINSVQTGPGFLTFSQTNYVVSEGATNAVITVLRTNGNHGQISVELTTAGGTAIPGINYSNATTLLVFADGQNYATDNVPVIQLTNAMPDTTVNLTLSNPGGNPPPALASPTAAVLTIQNDIPSFSFNSASYFVNEGAGSATLTILRSGPTNIPAKVSYTTSSPVNASETNGFAVPNVDYTPTSGTLSFPAGVTLETIPVGILQTTNVNPVISFQVLLQNPTGGTQIGSPGTATVGIVSDVTGFNFLTNAYFVGENGTNISVTVNRENPGTGIVSVDYKTVDNTAVAGVDYVATNGTLTFSAGLATTNVNVQILNPNLVENNKTFNIVLSNPTGGAYVVPPSSTTVTITNVYIGLSFGNPSFTVSECSTSAVIPVVLSGLTNSTVNVYYSTANGSGAAGVNYFATSGELTFVPGQTSTNFYVTPINNHVIGPDHTVVLNLSYTDPVPPGAAGVQLLSPSTALLTIQECNGAFIVNSGTAFVTGNIQPSTGVIYSNEIVTVLLGLRDIAGGDADNLVGTLVLSNGISSNGVTGFASSQNYGTVVENGPTVSQPFTFRALGSNGQNITATLNLQDASNTNLGSISYGFTIGGSTISYTNGNTIFLPENATAPTIATNSIAPGYGYPSLINIAGIPGLITKATVTFSNFGHSFPSDVDAVLEAPNGTNSILMSHVGGSQGVGNVDGTAYGPMVTLTFDQTASSHLPLSAKLTSGTYLPTTNTLKMQQLPPVPKGVSVPVAPPQSPYPYAANLNSLIGSSPNGNWSLWAICDETLDAGYISNGWILSISTGVPVENDSDLQLTSTPVPVQATVANLFVYEVTVTNYGPSAATNVVITDYVPAGVTYVSNSCGCGVFTNGALTVSVPTLAVGAGTAFNVMVEPTSLGYITNAVTALALQPDANSNNIVTNINLVGIPSADVGVSLVVSPDPTVVGAAVNFTVTVINNGFSDAGSVTNTIVMPYGFMPQGPGLTNSTETITTSSVNGTYTVTWVLNDLPNSATQTLYLVFVPTVGGIGLCSVSESDGIYDPLKGNNYDSAKVEVDLPMLLIYKDPHLSWSAIATNYTLQGAVTLPPPGSNSLWVNIPVPLGTNGQYNYELPGTSGFHFFRLSAPMP